MICFACASWITPVVDRAAHTLQCPACGSLEAYEPFPLFIVTGASGTGKTAAISTLRPLLPTWDVFETDVLWDSGGSWDFVWSNWLRVAHSIAQSGRPTILCGTVTPERIKGCDHFYYFEPISYLALHCSDTARETRLRNRPTWRGCTEEFIEGQRTFAQWLLDNATMAFDPVLTVFDTTECTVAETAQGVHRWAIEQWKVTRGTA